VHFRTELSCEKDLNDEYRACIESLDQLYQDVSRQIGDLESALGQIEKYQHEVQTLKQKLIQEEQLLKTMTASHHDANDERIQVGVSFESAHMHYFSFINLTEVLTTYFR
jgi:exonuclease VII small subunit